MYGNSMLLNCMPLTKAFPFSLTVFDGAWVYAWCFAKGCIPTGDPFHDVPRISSFSFSHDSGSPGDEAAVFLLLFGWFVLIFS